MNREYDRAFEEAKVYLSPGVFEKPVKILDKSVTYGLTNYFDNSMVAFGVGIKVKILSQNNKLFSYEQHAFVSMPKLDEKPAITILLNIARDTIQELLTRMNESQDYKSLKIPPQNIPFVEGNANAVKQTWTNYHP